MGLLRACSYFAAIALTAAAASAGQDPLLNHMTGHWVLRGVIAGEKTTHDVDAVWILQDTYVQFREVSREKDAAGKPKYEAEVLIGYDPAKKHYVCFWYDNTGVASPSTGAIAQRQADSLPFVFKTGQGDFHTTFAYQSNADTWTWAMDGEEGGKLKSFARVSLTRR